MTQPLTAARPARANEVSGTTPLSSNSKVTLGSSSEVTLGSSVLKNRNHFLTIRNSYLSEYLFLHFLENRNS